MMMNFNQFNENSSDPKQLTRTLKVIADMYLSEESGSSEHPCEYFGDGTKLRELAETLSDLKLRSILSRMADYSQYDCW